MKDGLFFEDNALIYYKNGKPCHAGAIKIDDAIYYIGSKGRAVKGTHVVHRDMANNILKRGTYTFGDDYKLVKDSYVAPKRKKSKKKSKTTKRFVFYTALALIVVLLVCIILFEFSNNSLANPSANVPDSTESAVTVTLKDEDILLCSYSAKEEFDGQLLLREAVYTGNPYRALQFTYQLSGESGVLLLSEDPTLTYTQHYVLPAGTTKISIDNLKTDTTYYYKVIVNGQEYPGSFHTAASTRFVSIPGLANTRDIGGYITQDGYRVRQGLLIRGVELDGLVSTDYIIPEEYLASVRELFGFVYDFDLRSASIYQGAYTSRFDIPHKFYNSPAYGSIFNKEYQDSIRQIFSDLADPQKYPMYMHCTWGTDRTGTIVFLLQGILNMSAEDMLREYELTGYIAPSIVDNGNLDTIISGLQGYEGDTIQEKIVTYLTTEVGITESEIESIRSIFLEGYPAS